MGNFKLGDVVLIKKGGYGFLAEDEDKYVEVVGFGDYYDDPGLETVAYGDCELLTEAEYGEVGYNGFVGYESFGENPMVLLNTKEKLILEEHPLESYPEREVGSKAIKSDGGSSAYYDIKIPEHYLRIMQESGILKVEQLIDLLFNNDFDFGCAFKALIRAKGITVGAGKEGNTLKYEVNKIKYYSDKIEEKYDWKTGEC